jgi:hypothetical protein
MKNKKNYNKYQLLCFNKHKKFAEIKKLETSLKKLQKQVNSLQNPKTINDNEKQ